jgi:hypothetical protein
MYRASCSPLRRVRTLGSDQSEGASSLDCLMVRADPSTNERAGIYLGAQHLDEPSSSAYRALPVVIVSSPGVRSARDRDR